MQSETQMQAIRPDLQMINKRKKNEIKRENEKLPMKGFYRPGGPLRKKKRGESI